MFVNDCYIRITNQTVNIIAQQIPGINVGNLLANYELAESRKEHVYAWLYRHKLADYVATYMIMTEADMVKQFPDLVIAPESNRHLVRL